MHACLHRDTVLRIHDFGIFERLLTFPVVQNFGNV